MNRVIIALLIIFSALSIHSVDVQAQVSRMDTTSSRPVPAVTSNFGIGLQTFPFPGITAQARLGRARPNPGRQ